MTFSTFDPGTLGTSVALTNTNHTATSSAGATITGAKSQSDKTAAKLYVEFTLNTAVSTNTGIGLMLPTAAYSTLSTGGLIYFKSGNIRLNGVTVNSTTGTPVSGDTLCMAIDFPNRLAWFRLNAGNWNGTAGNDPATGVGGISFSSPFLVFDPAYFVAMFGATGDQVTVNAGDSAFLQTVPTGYAGWDNVSDPTALVLSQVGVEIAMVGNPNLVLTQLGVEIAYNLVPALVLTQLGVEIAFDQQSLGGQSQSQIFVVVA